MAILTLVGRQDVVGRFRCCFYESGLRMTGLAFARRAGKYAADMAGAAVGISVRSFQRPAGGKMIEFRVKGSLAICQSCKQQ